jgi:hypothetical protein
MADSPALLDRFGKYDTDWKTKLMLLDAAPVEVTSDAEEVRRAMAEMRKQRKPRFVRQEEEVGDLPLSPATSPVPQKEKSSPSTSQSTMPPPPRATMAVNKNDAARTGVVGTSSLTELATSPLHSSPPLQQYASSDTADQTTPGLASTELSSQTEDNLPVRLGAVKASGRSRRIESSDEEEDDFERQSPTPKARRTLPHSPSVESESSGGEVVRKPPRATVDEFMSTLRDEAEAEISDATAELSHISDVEDVEEGEDRKPSKAAKSKSVKVSYA